MTCSSKANPPVETFIWYWDGSLLTEDPTEYAIVNTRDKDNTTTVSILKIKDVQRSDYGTYKCEATTDLGSASSVINFTLFCEYLRVNSIEIHRLFHKNKKVLKQKVLSYQASSRP